MEHILVTGLDGSGKSTVLNALAKLKKSSPVDVIYLPHIDIQNIDNNPQLKATAKFINELNHEADLLEIPQLKAIAIFSSMLLFKELVVYKSVPGIKTLFLERHPLIDTSIYAHFYAGKMGESKIDNSHIKRLDSLYRNEIRHIVHLIPNRFIHRKSDSIVFFAEFLHEWFFIEKKLGIKELTNLFHIELPAKIFYLKADAKVLMHRLSGRTLYEAHESLDVLTLLSHAYDDLFSMLMEEFPGMIEVIDAGNATTLNEFQKRLTEAYQ